MSMQISSFRNMLFKFYCNLSAKKIKIKMIVENRIIMVVFQKVDSSLTDDLAGRTTEKPGF